MDGGARRKTGAGRLRDPPGLAHPRVVASHHVIANIIHEQGANLRRNVNRPGVRKRPLKRICFHSISPGNGPSCRPGVKHRGTVAGRYQAIPNLALPRRLIGIGRSGFYWRTDERLIGGRSQFRAAHGGVCRLRNVHLCRWRFWQDGPRVARLRAHRSSLTACRGRRCLGVAQTIGCQCATEKRERCEKQLFTSRTVGSAPSYRQLLSLYCTRGQAVTGPLVMVSPSTIGRAPPDRTRGETVALDPKRAKVLL